MIVDIVNKNDERIGNLLQEEKFEKKEISWEVEYKCRFPCAS